MFYKENLFRRALKNHIETAKKKKTPNNKMSLKIKKNICKILNLTMASEKYS